MSYDITKKVQEALADLMREAFPDIPIYTDEPMSTERDTHFLGFARLQMPELDSLFALLYQAYATGDQVKRDEYSQRIETLLAQRAYDLASFAVYKSMRGCSLTQIPDITDWSIMTEDRKFDI